MQNHLSTRNANFMKSARCRKRKIISVFKSLQSFLHLSHPYPLVRSVEILENGNINLHKRWDLSIYIVKSTINVEWITRSFINNSALFTIGNKIQIDNNKTTSLPFHPHSIQFLWCILLSLFILPSLVELLLHIWFGLVSLPLNVPIIRLLMMCHNWGSPVFLAMIKCCLHGETSKWVIGPPGTVMQRICDGSGTGNQPVSGTSCEMFWINFHD